MRPPSTTKQPTGEQLRKAALDLLKATRSALVRRAQRAILTYLVSGHQDIDADVIRGLVELPPKIDPKVFGSVPTGLSRARLVKSNGMRKSTRKEAHGRKIEIWELVSESKARQWLATYPELPAPLRESLTQPTLFDGPQVPKEGN